MKVLLILAPIFLCSGAAFLIGYFLARWQDRDFLDRLYAYYDCQRQLHVARALLRELLNRADWASKDNFDRWNDAADKTRKLLGDQP